MSIFGECEEVRAILAQPAEQHQGEPALWVHPAYLARRQGMAPLAIDATLDRIAPGQIPLYTHADPDEVEWLRAELERMRERVTPTGSPDGQND